MSLAQDGKYASERLIATVLGGNPVVNDRVTACISRILERFGGAGRERMALLPWLSEYPSEAEVEGWQQQLESVEREFDTDERRRDELRKDLNQLKFSWS